MAAAARSIPSTFVGLTTCECNTVFDNVAAYVAAWNV